ncbi:MAG: hypothetical protein KDB18_09725, partial [Salinibacterium sp.]|nr:hypothetical protein [Salinibacterium sp.]
GSEDKKSLHPSAQAARLVAMCLCAVTISNMGWWRLFFPAGASDLRIAYVNLSAQLPESWPTLDEPVDVLVVANRPYSADLEPAWTWVGASADERDAAIIGRCALMTGLRVRRYAMTHVKFDDVWPADDSPEPGWAAWVELEREDGSPIILWVLDLPSPISISRTIAVQRTLDTIQAWRGMATEIDDQFQRTSRLSQGFPVPDMVVGDFNTPRWSRSLYPLKSKFDLWET